MSSPRFLFFCVAFCRSLSDLRFTDSNEPFGILKFFLRVSQSLLSIFVCLAFCRPLFVFCPYYFGYCIVFLCYYTFDIFNLFSRVHYQLIMCHCFVNILDPCTLCFYRMSWLNYSFMMPTASSYNWSSYSPSSDKYVCVFVT